MSEETTVIELQDVLNTLRNSIHRDLRVSFPGIVNSFDATKGTVDVQPALRELYEGEDGSIVNERHAVIPSVPVVYPGGGGFRITFPLQMGDTGLVVVGDRTIDKWLAGTGGEVDADEDRKHDMSDAVFIPGLKTTAKPWNDINMQYMTVGQDAQAAMAHSVALADKVAMALNYLYAGLKGAAMDAVSITGALTAFTAANPMAPVFPIIETVSLPSIGSSSFKVKE